MLNSPSLQTNVSAAGIGSGASAISNPGVAYVRTDGNDGTAEIGNPTKPFLTTQEAFDQGASSFIFGAGDMGTLDLPLAGDVVLSLIADGPATLTINRGTAPVAADDQPGEDIGSLIVRSCGEMVNISLCVQSGEGGNLDVETGTRGGDIGYCHLYHCHFGLLKLFPGEGQGDGRRGSLVDAQIIGCVFNGDVDVVLCSTNESGALGYISGCLTDKTASPLAGMSLTAQSDSGQASSIIIENSVLGVGAGTTGFTFNEDGGGASVISASCSSIWAADPLLVPSVLTYSTIDNAVP